MIPGMATVAMDMAMVATVMDMAMVMETIKRRNLFLISLKNDKLKSSKKKRIIFDSLFFWMIDFAMPTISHYNAF